MYVADRGAGGKGPPALCSRRRRSAADRIDGAGTEEGGDRQEST